MSYVIYCRKSTDESTEKQIQSIPDQMKECMEWAQQEWYEIAPRPTNFSVFESEEEIDKQDRDDSPRNKEIYQKYRWYFIVKEQKTAKNPGVREKRKQLIKMVKNGTVKWIISYHPDRQARNMEDWWALITLVDNGLLDLKYTRFHFEPTATGKMMLGFLFVFSKNYSDTISENVTRWLKWNVEDGKWVGKAKYGYFINDEWYHEPDTKKKWENWELPSNFELMKAAFHMKIYEQKTHEEIWLWLEKNDFTRNKSKWKTIEKAGWKNFSRVLKDPFYYWMYLHWSASTDLRLSNPYFQPLITEEEYVILLEIINKDSRTNPKEVRNVNEDINPLPKWIIFAADWTSMIHSVPNKQRLYKKLESVRTTNPLATLSDVVKTNNIYYEVKWKKLSEFNNLSITYEEIEKELINVFKKISITEEDYQEYKNYWQVVYVEEQERKAERLQLLQLQRNHLQWKLNKFLSKNLWEKRDEQEQEVYDKERRQKQFIIDSIDKEISETKTSERNSIAEFESFLEVFKEMASRFVKLDYVRKRNFIKVMVSNITIYEKKRVGITLFPYLKWLLVSELADNETRTRSIFLGKEVH